MEEKPKKTVKIVDRDRSRDQLLEQVTETTYRRTRTVQLVQDTYSSEDDRPQVEWRKMDIVNQRRDSGQSTSTPTHSGTKQSESQKLISFWDLVGSERADTVLPGSLLAFEASTNISSPQENSTGRIYQKIIKVDLTADCCISSTEVILVGDKKAFGSPERKNSD